MPLPQWTYQIALLVLLCACVHLHASGDYVPRQLWYAIATAAAVCVAMLVGGESR